MSNPLSKLFGHIDKLATGKGGEVPTDIPCRAEIIALRQCLEGSPDGVRKDAHTRWTEI